MSTLHQNHPAAANSPIYFYKAGYRAARLIWFAAGLFAVGILVVSIPAFLANLGRITPQERLSWYTVGLNADRFLPYEFPIDVVGMVSSLGASLLSIGLAVLIFRYRPNELMSYLVSLFLLLFAALIPGSIEVLVAYRPEWIPLMTYGQTIIMMPLVSAIMLLFPNGRFAPGWMRWAPVGLALWLIGTTLVPSLQVWNVNAFFGSIKAFWALIPPALAVGDQIYRYIWVSTPTERKQSRWALFGFLMWIVTVSVGGAIFFIVDVKNVTSPIAVFALSSSRLLWWIGLMIIPFTLSVALFRHRLWDIDVIIKRTVVYSLVTGLLAVIYFGVITFSQNIFVRLAGQGSPLAIVISTLAIAALFNPLRNRVQTIVDRRFYRQKYDAQRIVEEFSASLRDEVELEHLEADLVRVVEATMQPESISLWVADPGGQSIVTKGDFAS